MGATMSDKSYPQVELHSCIAYRDATVQLCPVDNFDFAQLACNPDATGGLKALAHKVLQRNRPRNRDATSPVENPKTDATCGATVQPHVQLSVPADLEAAIHQMAAFWCYSAEDLADALTRASEDPEGWRRLVEHDAQTFGWATQAVTPAIDPAPTCTACNHWTADAINPTAGLGECAIRKAGSLPLPWPAATCHRHTNSATPAPGAAKTEKKPNQTEIPQTTNTNEANPMSLTVSENSSASFEPAPAGAHPARLSRLIDLGSQPTSFDGKERLQPKVLLQWELLIPERTDDGKCFSVSKRYTPSLHERSALRKDAESWRGRPFTPDEAAGFDLRRMLGAVALLNVTLVERQGRTYANVASLMPMPRGMQHPPGTETPLAFDLSAPDWDVFEKLGPRIQEQIRNSPEYQAIPAIRDAAAPVPPRTPPRQPRSQAEKYAAQAAADTATADFDDDIPF